MMKLKEIKRKTKSLRDIFRGVSLAGFLILISMSFACESSAPQKNLNKLAASPEVQITGIERDVKAMRTANFQYIFVFRRKDGGKLDGDDKKYLKDNSPADTNRFVLSDDEKSVVAGSSYEFKPENLKKLEERFEIENYSSIKTEENNANQATGEKSGNKAVDNK